jgi:hypothetical protein
MIGYYIHHHGAGHRNRAQSICRHLDSPVTALTSLRLDDAHPFQTVLELPRDDVGAPAGDPSAHGALHWAPHHDTGLRRRMACIAQWVDEIAPTAAVVDVSVEVATLLRLLGVPVIVVAMPGDRVDAPHRLVYHLADHIIAAWPQSVYAPTWLQPYADKTSYVGGISRFDGRAIEAAEPAGTPTVLVLQGAGGTSLRRAMITDWQQRHPEYRWRTLGIEGDSWVGDPWPAICAADVIVAHAGQNSVADIAAAGKPAIIIAQPRPFDEQAVTARNLARAGLAIVVDDWPDLGAWPGLIEAARRLDVSQWTRWQTAGAAARAAQTVAEVARRCALDGSA